jgi:hypothetical protein
MKGGAQKQKNSVLVATFATVNGFLAAASSAAAPVVCCWAIGGRARQQGRVNPAGRPRLDAVKAGVLLGH